MLPGQAEAMRAAMAARGFALYIWADRAGTRMHTGERYYRGIYRGRNYVTPEGGPPGQGRIGEIPLRRGQGVTFRTVSSAPAQAAAWWYPARMGRRLSDAALRALRWLGVV
jgi:hypothetical protein